MDTATRILIVGGMSVLAFGLLLGIPMAAARGKAPRAPRYLFAAHLAAIIQGGLLLALTIAIGFSALSSGVATTAAALLVGGVALFDLGLALNWVQGVQTRSVRSRSATRFRPPGRHSSSWVRVSSSSV